MTGKPIHFPCTTVFALGVASHLLFDEAIGPDSISRARLAGPGSSGPPKFPLSLEVVVPPVRLTGVQARGCSRNWVGRPGEFRIPENIT